MTGAEVRTPGTGVRATRQRAAIMALLDSVDEFRSAQELHDELRRRGENIGLTTVYRTLQSLSSVDLVDMVRTDTGESVYRRCSAPDHHHHLVCRRCGSAVEVSGREKVRLRIDDDETRPQGSDLGNELLDLNPGG